jgi:hypothetical protein
MLWVVYKLTLIFWLCLPLRLPQEALTLMAISRVYKLEILSQAPEISCPPRHLRLGAAHLERQLLVGPFERSLARVRHRGQRRRC